MCFNPIVLVLEHLELFLLLHLLRVVPLDQDLFFLDARRACLLLLHVLLEEDREPNHRVLDLDVLVTQFVFLLLELELGLCAVLLLVFVLLLLLVHLAPALQQLCGW